MFNGWDRAIALAPPLITRLRLGRQPYASGRSKFGPCSKVSRQQPHHQAQPSTLGLRQPHECERTTMAQPQVAHTDSIDAQDPNNEVQKKVKSRRPASTIAPSSCYGNFSRLNGL